MVEERRTELQEERAEVAVQAIPVVMIDHRRRSDNPRIALASFRVSATLGAKHRSLLLRLADEYYAFRLVDATQLFLHHVVLPLSLLNRDQRYVVVFGE